ncbi:MAG: YccF domain-containing protein, partial [Oscillospiraceae bacterium]
GIQCFKFAALAFFPFGRQVEYGGGAVSLLCNLLWLLFGGIALATEAALVGCLFCLTLVGIPFGLQSFKLAGLALMPFGARVVSIGAAQAPNG